MYYIGLDVHKKTISYAIKLADGAAHREGVVNATRTALDDWIKLLPQPWTGAMEATLFTGWIYDHLLPHAASLKVAHPLMLRANLLPECYLAPVAIRERRRTLRYRNLLVRQSVQMKNKMAGLLMETGVTYNKQKLHQKRYFAQLLQESAELPAALKPLLKIGRKTVDRTAATGKALLRALQHDPVLQARVERLTSIPVSAP